MNQLSVQVVISAVIVYLLQVAKMSRLIPWVTAETAKLNRIVAVLASLFATVGIHFSFSVTQGVLTITGLTLASIGQFLWRWLVSFTSQELIFQTTVSKPTLSLPPQLLEFLHEWAKQQQGLPTARDLDVDAEQRGAS